MAQPLSGLGFTLTEEDREQKDGEMYQLLVVQLQFDCQLEHGNSLVCAGRPANLLKVGFGGYEEPAAREGREVSWPPNGGVAITTGNCPPQCALAGGTGEDFQFIEPNVKVQRTTKAKLLAVRWNALLGVVAAVLQFTAFFYSHRRKTWFSQPPCLVQPFATGCLNRCPRVQ